MIIAVFPFEFYFLRDKVMANLVVDVSLVGLAELVASWNAEHFSVFDEMSTCLMKTKRNVFGNALLPDVKYPVVIAWPCIHSRLSANRYFLNRFIQIRGEVNGGENGRDDDALVLDGERQKNGQTIIDHFLIFHCASHNDIVITLAPVVGHTFHETVDAFGEKEKPEIAPLFHHPPAFGSPLVCIFQEEVGGETSEDYLAALNLPRLVAFPLHRQVEIARLAALAARNLAAVHLILTVNVTVFAPSANLGAAVPRIPVGIYFPMLGHSLV